MYVISSIIKEYSVSGEISETTIQLHCFKSLFGKHYHYLEKNGFFLFIHLLQQTFLLLAKEEKNNNRTKLIMQRWFKALVDTICHH